MMATDVTISTSRAAASTWSGAGRQSRLNDAMSWAIVVVLALVPLPFGSVHGFSWGFFALVTGLGGIVYAFGLARLREGFRYPISAMPVMALLFGLFLAALVVQILPLGALLGPFTVVGTGELAITTQTLSITADATTLMLLRQLTYGVFFFLVLQVSYNDARRRLLLNAILIIICAYATLAIVSLQTGDTVLGIGKTAYQGSATGPYVNRNSFATLLAFGATIAAGQIARRVADQVDRHRHDGAVPGIVSSVAIYAIAYILLITVTFATQSRMGLLVALAGTGVVIVVFLSRVARSRRIMLVTLVGVLAAMSIGAVLFGDAMLTRLIDLELSADGRSQLYAQVLDLIRLRPWTGFGGGSFELAYPLVHESPVNVNYTWDKAHNTYLALWSEMGVIAGSLPIVLMAIVAFTLIRSLLRPTATGWMSQAIALAVLTLSALHSLVDFSLEIQANTFMFLALIAAGLSAARSQSKKA